MDHDEQYFASIIDKIVFNDDMTFLEFGVASGNMLCALLNILIGINKIPKNVVGFDSFKGLPKEESGVPRSPEWVEGAFNLLHENKNNKKIQVKANTFEEAYLALKNRFKQYENHGLSVKFVEGFYSESLVSQVVTDYNIKPACFVHIDCDLYISAKQALEFCVTNNLFAQDCLVRYDDWGGTAEGIGGESKAHYEMQRKYKLVWETLEKSRGALFRYKGKI